MCGLLCGVSEQLSPAPSDLATRICATLLSASFLALLLKFVGGGTFGSGLYRYDEYSSLVEKSLCNHKANIALPRAYVWCVQFASLYCKGYFKAAPTIV